MEWLTPITGLIAAAVAVPTLVLLYFLKLKRQNQTVSSTLLWQRAVQDLQVNAPFQRLRRNLLLLLQLLALLAVLVALAGPIWSLRDGAGRRLVLLIDRSASMSARDVEGHAHRLAAAQVQAQTVIDSLRSGSLFAWQEQPDQAMVIAFDDHAQVMCNFTSNREQLLRAVRAIAPSDRGTSLQEALTVARAYSQPGQNGETTASLALFSDGRIEDVNQLDLSGESWTYHCIGTTRDNVAITALQARRSFEEPDQVAVFVQVANTGTQAMTCDIQVALDNNIVAIRPLTLEPMKEGLPGTGALEIQIQCPAGGLLEVRHLAQDALAADNQAWAVIDPPQPLRVALVTAGNALLESALRHCPLARLDLVSPEDFNGVMDWDYDVTILEGCSVENVPPTGRFVIFGPPPRDWQVESDVILENQWLVDWHSHHPLLRHVNLANLFVAQAQAVTLPRDVQVLAQFSQSPAVGLQQQGARTVVWVGFDPLESNWPFDPGFVLFCYNCLDVLGAQAVATQGRQLLSGDTLLVQGIAPHQEVTVTSPDRSQQVLQTDAAGTLRFPGTENVGVYRLTLKDQTSRIYPVNLLRMQESVIAPQREMAFGGDLLEAEAGDVQRANIPLWPWAVGLALILVLIEWWVYNGKLRL